MRYISKKSILYIIFALFLPVLILFFGVFFNWFGSYSGPGEVAKFSNSQQPFLINKEGKEIGELDAKQILFGDLHVHTTFSFDAFMLNLPIAQGEGTHPVADACNFARFCSSLDFFAVTDHAEWLTQREWKDSIKSIQNCAFVSNKLDQPEVIPFLGWEWTQTSMSKDKHYGHKNIIFKNIEIDKIPAKPISTNSGQFDRFVHTNPLLISGAIALDFPHMRNYFNWRYKSLVASTLEECNEKFSFLNSSECVQKADSPSQLYKKLKDFSFELMVIPHGTAWGNTTPTFASWDIQLNSEDHDPKLSKLIEIYSGHGNSEEYRTWLPFKINSNGTLSCEQPTQNYLPDCFQAGEIIRERCRIAAGSQEECNRRAIEARMNYVESFPFGLFSVPGYDPKEWKDSGQCKDCFLPAFDYRPRMSAQYALAITDFSNDVPHRYKFGFIGSSDNHQARPGSGYKENLRLLNTESRINMQNLEGRSFLNPRLTEPKLPKSNKVHFDSKSESSLPLQAERASSFLYTGGLVAVHSEDRKRESLWKAMNSREVYATSGERILLWFNLINHRSGKVFPMGSELAMEDNPIFNVRALGAQFQKPGCNDLFETGEVQEIIKRICKEECFNPSDQRKDIKRIEVVRIRPQSYEDEPLENLIEDPWKVFECEPSQEGCQIEFQDQQFSIGNREVIYYVRAIQAPSLAINADGLGCERKGEKCEKVNLCGDIEGKGHGDCLGLTEERAWSSPIYVSFSSSPP